MHHAQLYKPHPWPHQLITTEVIVVVFFTVSIVLLKVLSACLHVLLMIMYFVQTYEGPQDLGPWP